jgi:membrane-associated protein
MHIQDLLHIDKQLDTLIRTYHDGSYGLLFGILFAETGFVVTPFLPGDTLLFAAGIFAHPDRHAFNLPILLLVLTAAPICGDTVNYHIGKWLGPHIFNREKPGILNKHHLEETHSFFERYGARAVMLARWVPIVRTFAPFVAGMSGMPFRTFIGWSALGAWIWVWACTLAGYFFGRNAWVKNNFEFAMLGMVLVTVAPLAYHAIKARNRAKLSANRNASIAES